MKRIAIFGDSIGKGVVFDENCGKYVCSPDSFARLLEKDTALDNFSRFGNTVTRGEKLVSQKKDVLKEYDLLLLEYGGNDCDFDWGAVSEDPKRDHQCKTPLAVFTDTYRRMIETIREFGGRPALLTLPPIHSLRYFDWIKKGKDERNILSFLGEKERIARWQEMYNDALYRIAAFCRVPVLDIRTPFLSKRDFKDYLCLDGIHPNQKGQMLIYQSLLAESKALLP